MKRRDFLKSLGASSFAVNLPMGLTLGALPIASQASIDYGDVGFDADKAPPVMPQVIDIFLNGGPSELAGNLTNIQQINANSLNAYTEVFGADFLKTASDGGQITRNDLWKDAGGEQMEAMLANQQMSIYRTMSRKKQYYGNHAYNLYRNATGAVGGGEGPAGKGTRLATYLRDYRHHFENSIPLADGTLFDNIEDLFIPFIAIDRPHNVFRLAEQDNLPKALRGKTLGRALNFNPFRRKNILRGDDVDNLNALNALAAKMTSPQYQSRYIQSSDAMNARQRLVDAVDNLLVNAAPPPMSAIYPDNEIGESIKAAVMLALACPSTFYIVIGGGQLGGWDQHRGAFNYPHKMKQVMLAMQAAMNHIRDYNLTNNTMYGRPRTTANNIVINMFGDFGRRTNLNTSMGWDHGNTQNFYTFGGSDLRPQGLGKIVGQTHLVGTPKENNQFNAPLGLRTGSDNSGNEDTYTFETAAAIASTTYSYFGAENTAPLTVAYYKKKHEGVQAIDQSDQIENLYRA